MGAVLVLASVAYPIHRLPFRESPQTVRRRAAVDTWLTGFVTGPGLLAAIVVVATIRECSFGTGCYAAGRSPPASSKSGRTLAPPILAGARASAMTRFAPTKAGSRG